MQTLKNAFKISVELSNCSQYAGPLEKQLSLLVYLRFATTMQLTTVYLHKLICLNLIKLTFLDSSLQDLSDDIKFDWFLRCLHFPIVFGNDIISCYMVFKFTYFVKLTKGYQPKKFQCCRLCGSSFIEGL